MKNTGGEDRLVGVEKVVKVFKVLGCETVESNADL